MHTNLLDERVASGAASGQGMLCMLWVLTHVGCLGKGWLCVLQVTRAWLQALAQVGPIQAGSGSRRLPVTRAWLMWVALKQVSGGLSVARHTAGTACVQLGCPVISSKAQMS